VNPSIQDSKADYLIASGLLHAGFFLVMDRAREDPLSFRRATHFDSLPVFGIL
jgi:hypothetical protein